MFSSILSSILSSSSFSSKDVSLKTIGNYYNRFKYYNQSQENLENLNKFECLIPLKSGKEFKISNSKLILKNRIGSNSRYGLVYLTLFNNFKYATKLTPINKYNLNEIILVKKLSDITIQDLNPHFLLTYKLFICNNEFEIINSLKSASLESAVSFVLVIDVLKVTLFLVGGGVGGVGGVGGAGRSCIAGIWLFI